MLHGCELKDGDKRRGKLRYLAQLLGDPIAKKLDAERFATFRAERLKDVSANTANHDSAYLRALFNDLRRLGAIDYENPIGKVRRIKTSETELAFLTHEEITNLLDALADDWDARMIACVCRATGARWSEAEGLKGSQVQRNRVTFTDTKNGKSRTVPITPELSSAIKRGSSGRLFTPCSHAFT